MNYDDDARSAPYRDHNGRLRGNPKFGCTGGYCRTGRCETPCDPGPEEEEQYPDGGGPYQEEPVELWYWHSDDGEIGGWEDLAEAQRTTTAQNGGRPLAGGRWLFGPWLDPHKF